MTAELRQRIQVLRETITAAERKIQGVGQAIDSRRKTLQRLEAQLAMRESIPSSPTHEQ